MGSNCQWWCSWRRHSAARQGLTSQLQQQGSVRTRSVHPQSPEKNVQVRAMALGAHHSPVPSLEGCTSGPEAGEETPKGPKPAVLKVTTTKTIPSFKLLCLKRKDISYPFLSVPGGKSVPCPVLGTYDGSNVSMNSSFFKKQSKNIFSKDFSETWNTPVVFYFYACRLEFQGRCSRCWLHLWFQQEQGRARVLCKLARNLCISVMLD